MLPVSAWELDVLDELRGTESGNFCENQIDFTQGKGFFESVSNLK